MTTEQKNDVLISLQFTGKQIDWFKEIEKIESLIESFKEIKAEIENEIKEKKDGK